MRHVPFLPHAILSYPPGERFPRSFQQMRSLRGLEDMAMSQQDQWPVHTRAACLHDCTAWSLPLGPRQSTSRELRSRGWGFSRHQISHWPSHEKIRLSATCPQQIRKWTGTDVITWPAGQLRGRSRPHPTTTLEIC